VEALADGSASFSIEVSKVDCDWHI